MRSVIRKAVPIRGLKNLKVRSSMAEVKSLEGEELAVISVGSMTEVCEEVCKELKERGQKTDICKCKICQTTGYWTS